MKPPPDRFYDEMCEQLEEAQDRAVLARWRTLCPQMTEEHVEWTWTALVKQTNRVAARLLLARAMDLGLFDEYGEVDDDDE